MIPFTIKEALAADYPEIGALLVATYASLPGMPRLEEQPDYYQRLRDVKERTKNPSIHVFAATGGDGQLMGAVDFIDDMAHYASGGSASAIMDGAGIRLLTVAPQYRGFGIGKALTRFCIAKAKALKRARVILHTTNAMKPAWAMYEKIGFVRFPELDFSQGQLEVFGFKLDL